MEDVKCFCCGQMGHCSTDCPKINKTHMKDWAIKEKPKGNLGRRVHWSGAQMAHQCHQVCQQVSSHGRNTTQPELKEADFKNDSLLDAGATMNSAKNEDLLAGVCESDKPAMMCTNTGKHKRNKKGTLTGVDADPWHDEESLANAMRFGELAKESRTTCDSMVSDSFHQHSEIGLVEFKKSEEGLCAFTVPKVHKEHAAECDSDTAAEETTLVNAVAEN